MALELESASLVLLRHKLRISPPCHPELCEGSVAPGEAWERGKPRGGNLSLESRGFDSLPVKANHQPEASLACEYGNVLLEA
jgi:hypothetical protein